MYGATRCADQGYGAMEVSLNRTSDGVWFGLHDETLLRVAGVDIDPTTLTWQELSQYRINPPGTAPNQPSRPFMRVEEIIDSYGSSHVLVIDPKYRLNESSALFDLLLTMQPASRMVAKYAGNGRGLADIVRPKGITSWGYYYAATWDANKQYASAWDLLGMEWNASQTVWDEVIAFGKPTIAHICATKAESDAGFAKGADGVQVSGVLSVLDRDDS